MTTLPEIASQKEVIYEKHKIAAQTYINYNIQRFISSTIEMFGYDSIVRLFDTHKDLTFLLCVKSMLADNYNCKSNIGILNYKYYIYIDNIENWILQNKDTNDNLIKDLINSFTYGIYKYNAKFQKNVDTHLEDVLSTICKQLAYGDNDSEHFVFNEKECEKTMSILKDLYNFEVCYIEDKGKSYFKIKNLHKWTDDYIFNNDTIKFLNKMRESIKTYNDYIISNHFEKYIETFLLKYIPDFISTGYFDSCREVYYDKAKIANNYLRITFGLNTTMKTFDTNDYYDHYGPVRDITYKLVITKKDLIKWYNSKLHVLDTNDDTLLYNALLNIKSAMIIGCKNPKKTRSYK